MTARLRVFRDAQDLAETLADETASLLNTAIAARGRASMALPGGRTPTPFLTALGRRDVDWSRVTVTLVDDRWLPADNPDSNAATLHATLLAAAPAIRFIPLYTGAATPEEGEAACAEALRVLDGPFDLMVTGMGEDGHVASLFPDAPALAAAWEGTASCRAMRSPTAPHPRMTLTLPRLLDSRRIVVLITGGTKRAVLEQARAAGPEDAMPVRALLRRGGADTMVYWAP